MMDRFMYNGFAYFRCAIMVTQPIMMTMMMMVMTVKHVLSRGNMSMLKTFNKQFSLIISPI